MLILPISEIASGQVFAQPAKQACVTRCLYFLLLHVVTHYMRYFGDFFLQIFWIKHLIPEMLTAKDNINLDNLIKIFSLQIIVSNRNSSAL